jgi:hypothetical protein
MDQSVLRLSTLQRTPCVAVEFQTLVGPKVPMLPRAAEKSSHLPHHRPPCIAPLRPRQPLVDILERLFGRDFGSC